MTDEEIKEFYQNVSKRIDLSKLMRKAFYPDWEDWMETWDDYVEYGGLYPFLEKRD